MLTNAQPWDNLKFDVGGVMRCAESSSGNLCNTYSFFALYANVDGFDLSEPEVPVEERQEIDRWLISLLNTLVKKSVEDTRITILLLQAALSRISSATTSATVCASNRKRFWGGGLTPEDCRIQTLYEALKTVALPRLR